MSTSLFQQKCGLVAQEDYHWTFLTAKEAISYAADLYLPNLTSAQRTVEVENMIEKMGLTSCQNTIAGNQFIHGLSGGQKRRLSVAIALMKKLEIVFLDEPTSGLDAAAAAGIMVFLADVTKRERLITVFTVHQPSTNIFNSFDRVMLLSQGRVAYCGNQRNGPAHLQAIGHPLPPQMNPAEFLLDIVNTDFTEETEVLKVLDNWDSIGKPIQDQRIKQILDNAEKHPVEEEKRSTSGTFFSELWLLLKRHSLLASRDPLIYTGRLAIFLMCCVFFGIVYIHARVRSQDQTLNRFWFIIWICGVPSKLLIFDIIYYIVLLYILYE
jgi:ABC-type multidrug transport system ATPase subunit